MPPRKAKAAPKRALKDKSLTASVPSDIATPNTISKKRKIDWATIDDENTFPGFTLHPAKIKTPKTSKKQKSRKSTDGKPPAGDAGEYYKDAPLDADIVQKNPFVDSQLSETHYVVKPTAEWESTLRYRKFTISEAEFEVGQTIFVSKTEEEQDAESAIQYWIGKVLEVRAGDAAHVYLRVYWLYRPEDLPGGRQPYHADSELIASNHMDIIEALSVVDKATVIHWDEDMDKPWPLKEQLFWRQTFDVGKTKGKQLSKLRKICVDKAPCNPDGGLVQCPSCSEWLHDRCLETRAVVETQASSKRKGGRKSLSSVNLVEFTAKLTTLGDFGPTYLTVTDQRPKHVGERFNVDIKCLVCDALIEKAAEELPPEIPSETIVLSSREATVAEEEEEDFVVGKDEELPAPTSAIAEPGESTAEPSPSVDD
jgi:hypothetical protein